MSFKDKLIAVIGGSQPTAAETHLAAEIERELTRRGAVLVCGGLGGGMEAGTGRRITPSSIVGSLSEAVDKVLSLVPELER